MIKKFLCILFFGLFTNGHAQMVVEDASNLFQNTATAVNTAATLAEMIKQYKLLAQEYEMMVKNMAAPYFWVFKEVNDFEDNIEYYKEKYSKYTDKAAWEAHFASYLDPDTYSSSPCFKLGGCSKEENARIRANREAMIKNAGETSKKFVESFRELSNEYKKRTNILNKVAENAKRAEGNLQSQAATNDYLYLLNSNMEVLIKKMDAFSESYNNMLMLKLEEDAMKKAKNQRVLDESLKVKVPNDNRLYFTDISSKR